MITRCKVIEDIGSTFLDRIQNRDNELPDVSEIVSITAKSFDMEADDEEAIRSESFSPVSDYVMADYSTDNGWTRDKIGWNGRVSLGGEFWPEGDKTYRIQITYLFDDGYPVVCLYEAQCIKLYGS